MIFRDDYERQAHDIICIIKYGAVGGKVATHDMRRVGDILRGHTLDPPKPKIIVPITAPKVAMPNLVVTIPNVTAAIPIVIKKPFVIPPP